MACASSQLRERIQGLPPEARTLMTDTLGAMVRQARGRPQTAEQVSAMMRKTTELGLGRDAALALFEAPLAAGPTKTSKAGSSAIDWSRTDQLNPSDISVAMEHFDTKEERTDPRSALFRAGREVKEPKIRVDGSCPCPGSIECNYREIMLDVWGVIASNLDILLAVANSVDPSIAECLLSYVTSLRGVRLRVTELEGSTAGEVRRFTEGGETWMRSWIYVSCRQNTSLYNAALDLDNYMGDDAYMLQRAFQDVVNTVVHEMLHLCGVGHPGAFVLAKAFVTQMQARWAGTNESVDCSCWLSDPMNTMTSACSSYSEGRGVAIVAGCYHDGSDCVCAFVCTSGSGGQFSPLAMGGTCS